MNVHIATTTSDQLLKEWESLWNTSQMATMMNSPYWFQAAFHAFKPKAIRIICIYEEDQLRAVAPFFQEKHYGVPLYVTPLHDLGDKSSILCDFNNTPLTKLLILKIRELENVWLTGLSKIEFDSVQIAVPHARMIATDLNAYITIFEGIYGDFPKPMKAKVINRSKRSSQPLHVEHNEDNHTNWLPTIFEIDQNSVKQKKGRSIFGRKEVRVFFQNLYRLAPKRILISLLFFGEIPISYTLGFVCNNIYQGSQKAFLPGYEYYCPGSLLLLNVLELMHNKGSPEFDMGKGYDSFKSGFTKKTRPLYTVAFTKNNWTCNYLHKISLLRQTLYAFVEHHHTLYGAYKNLKNKIL